MLKSFKVKSSLATYQVIFKENKKNFINENTIFIIDSFFKKKKNFSINKNYVFIGANEYSKSYKYSSLLLKKLIKKKTNKKTTLVAIGGGTIQDICCFLCSVFMRGIKWIYVPTTLLGMVDSCIGGKSSINFEKFKNLIGTYYPPHKILIDISYLKTLRNEQLVDGLIELIKILYASRSYKNLQFVNKLLYKKNFNLPKVEYKKIIYLSLIHKKKIIEKDEFDNNERLLLNFGHTFGHAIEYASNYKISHGIAVGIGILVALNLSTIIYKKKQSSNEKMLKQLILKLLSTEKKIFSLYKRVNKKKILTAVLKDKKHNNVFYRFILTNKKGDLFVAKRKKHSVTTKLDIYKSLNLNI